MASADVSRAHAVPRACRRFFTSPTMTDDKAAALARMAARRAESGRTGAQLQEREKVWRDKQPFLASQGYSLRPRYHPGWRPSWELHHDAEPSDFEDYWPSPVCLPSIQMHVPDA